MSTEVTYGANEHGEPVATFTVTGAHDIYRLAFSLSRAQCDFADKGRGMFRFLAAAVPKALDYLDESLGTGVVKRHNLAATYGQRTEAVAAQRRYRCWAATEGGSGSDCLRVISPGDVYICTTLLPGSEHNDSGKPIVYRMCVNCSRDERSQEAIGARAVLKPRTSRPRASGAVASTAENVARRVETVTVGSGVL